MQVTERAAEISSNLQNYKKNYECTIWNLSHSNSAYAKKANA